MTTLDPNKHFIVVRHKDSGKHEHVTLQEVVQSVQTKVVELESADPRVSDLMRQIQIVAQALDDFRADVDRRFKAQADHMNRIASEAIITPELRQGAA